MFCFFCVCGHADELHTGADLGGGHGEPMPPPFGTEQAQNAEVYRALSAHSYSDAAHIYTCTDIPRTLRALGSNCTVYRTEDLGIYYTGKCFWQCHVHMLLHLIDPPSQYTK